MDDPEENPALSFFEKLCFATDNPEPPVWIEASDRIMDRLCIPEALRERLLGQRGPSLSGLDEMT